MIWYGAGLSMKVCLRAKGAVALKAKYDFVVEGGAVQDVKKLGFGLMRLPEVELEGKKAIDIAQVCDMVDAFLDEGFTYFDTAFGYHGGMSEVAAGEALVARHPRESFQLATKLPAWMAKDADDARSMFTTSLERTGAGYFDYYLLHNLGENRTALFDDMGLWDFARDLREQGLIRNLGFSIHDNAEALEAVLTKHPDVDFVQLQINYADWENPKIESRKCYEVARAHGLPIIVMEPVKGGSLMKLPDAAREVFAEVDPHSSLAGWALRFAASLPGVLTVLSGMSDLAQVRENTHIMRDFTPLSPDESAAVERVRAILDATDTVACTDCRYCVKGCPEGVRIPVIMESLNIVARFGDMGRAKENYLWNASRGPASACIGCGACEDVCPQHIEIISELERASALFD